MKNRLLAKTDQLLRAVTFAETPPTLHELSERLQIPLATLGRLASDLVEMGVLAKEGYYRLVPAPGLAALGTQAQKRTTLVRRCAPVIENFCSSSGMNAMLAGMEYGTIFLLWECGGSKVTEMSIWNSGGAAILLAGEKEDAAFALDFYERIHPDASAGAKLIFEREWEQAKREHFLLHVNTMRQWSFAALLTEFPSRTVLVIHGKGAEQTTPERFQFDASLLVSRLRRIMEADRE